MIVGVAIILFGATYPLWQVDRSSWGPYSTPGELLGENGNPIGVLGLYFTQIRSSALVTPSMCKQHSRLSTLHPFMIIEDSTLAAEAFSSERIIT
jgi:hypothetical protein